MSRQRWPTNSE